MQYTHVMKMQFVRLYAESRYGGRRDQEAGEKWNPNVKENNVELISNVTGKPVELVANEQSLPMSQKRKEKYD